MTADVVVMAMLRALFPDALNFRPAGFVFSDRTGFTRMVFMLDEDETFVVEDIDEFVKPTLARIELHEVADGLWAGMCKHKTVFYAEEVNR